MQALIYLATLVLSIPFFDGCSFIGSGTNSLKSSTLTKTLLKQNSFRAVYASISPSTANAVGRSIDATSIIAVPIVAVDRPTFLVLACTRSRIRIHLLLLHLLLLRATTIISEVHSIILKGDKNDAVWVKSEERATAQSWAKLTKYA